METPFSVSTIIQNLLKILILVCLILSLSFVLKSYVTENKTIIGNPKFTRASKLITYLKSYKKPKKIEFYSHTEKYNNEVLALQKLQMPTDPNSKFYISIQFFTDENDDLTPLIAQIRFFDANTDNLIKEQSINLD